MRLGCPIVLAMMLSLGNSAAAQEVGAAAKGFCWTERDASRCRSFLLFEHGYALALNQTKHCKTENGCWRVDPTGVPRPVINAEWEPDFTSNAFFDFGRMWYRGHRAALGFSVGIGVGLGDAYGHTYWLKYRQRRWTRSGLELELAGGPALSYAELWEMPDWVATRGGVVELKVAGRPHPPFAFRIGFQGFRGRHDRSATYAAVSFRSKGALIVSLLFPILWIAMYHP